MLVAGILGTSNQSSIPQVCACVVVRAVVAWRGRRVCARVVVFVGCARDCAVFVCVCDFVSIHKSADFC